MWLTPKIFKVDATVTKISVSLKPTLLIQIYQVDTTSDAFYKLVEDTWLTANLQADITVVPRLTVNCE